MYSGADWFICFRPGAAGSLSFTTIPFLRRVFSITSALASILELERK
jgi:hypothetical protein